MYALYKEKEANGGLVSHAEAIKMFLDFVGDCTIVGHNVNYDYNILDNNMKADIAARALAKGRCECSIP